MLILISHIIIFQAFTIFCGLGINNCMLYDELARSAAKQTVALEVSQIQFIYFYYYFFICHLLYNIYNVLDKYIKRYNYALDTFFYV